MIDNKVKKNFGFGCMRLPMANGEVDKAEFCRMIDTFMEAGFNYFDTAHGYLDGRSETALRDCLEILAQADTSIKMDHGSEWTLLEQTVTRLICRAQEG